MKGPSQMQNYCIFDLLSLAESKTPILAKRDQITASKYNDSLICLKFLTRDKCCTVHTKKC